VVSGKVHLDCSSPDSTLQSLAAILRLPPQEIHNRIHNFDLDEFFIRNPNHPVAPSKVVLERIAGPNASLDAPHTISWFHATRVPRNATFSEGIQPLNIRLEHIWRFLGQLASEWVTPGEWSQFRANLGGSGEFQYYLKTGEPVHWGPHAFLVRDVPLQVSETCNHDYLAGPEIVEDICQSFIDRFGQNLIGLFRAATCPCLVKFTSTIQRPDAVTCALYYLYCHFWDDGFPIDANTCFDGEGQTIPKEDIVDIEFFPDYDTSQRGLI